MKKLLIFTALVLAASISRAAYIETYQLSSTSFTLTSEGPVQVSTHGGILVGVIIDSPSLGGTLTLADAKIPITGGNLVTYSTFSILSLGGTGFTSVPTYIPYGVYLSSGLSYKTTSNTGGVTIIWKPFMSPSSGQ